MSFDLTQKVLRNHLNISPCEKLLLAILADKIDHKGYCYPSYNHLEKISGYCRRHVIRGIKSLAKQDLILITKIIGVGNQYKVLENFLDNHIECAKNEGATGDKKSLALVSSSHPPSDTVSPHWCQDVTLVTKEVNKEVDKGSKVIPKSEITKTNSDSIEGVGKKMKIADLDLVKLQKTNKKNMNPIDVWRNACVDFQNEHLLAIVDLKFTQVQAGTMNKVAKKLATMYQPCVETTVWNWDAFVKHVNLQTGGAKKPVTPDINFFVYHNHHALIFTMKKMHKSDTKIKSKKLKVTKKVVTDAHTKALLKAAGKLSGN